MVELKTTRREFKDGLDVGVDATHRIVIKLGARWGAIGLGMFDLNKAFILPEMIPFLQDVFAFALEHPNDACLIVGHCDASGEPHVNDPLSDIRSKTVQAWFKNDPEPWVQQYETGVSEKHRWGPVEDAAMLRRAQGFDERAKDPGAPPEGETDIEWFQRTRSLEVDDTAGPETRRQLIKEYFALSRLDPSTQSAPATPPKNPLKLHGAGENFPIERVRAERQAAIATTTPDATASGGDSTSASLAGSTQAGQAPAALSPASAATTTDGSERNPVDRRAEFYFFPNGRIAPAPKGRKGEEYLEWVRTATDSLGLFIFGEQSQVFAELHADFDRDGKLDVTGVDRLARGAAPGAIVAANVDVHDRALPNSVAAGAVREKDFQLPVASAKDGDLLPLVIKSLDPARSSGLQFLLRFVVVPNPAPGVPRTVVPRRIRLNDSSGVILRNPKGNGDERLLPPFKTDTVAVTLQSRTVAGSPFAHVARVDDLTFTKDNFDETNFELELISRTPGGSEIVHDRASFSVAPLIFSDRLVTPDRLYLCSLPDNVPSVRDVTDAMQTIPRTKLVIVPEDVGNTDTWLQDQYQAAITRTPGGGWRQILVHLPRVQSNMDIKAVKNNLAKFVDSHFPSQRVGVLTDLRERELSVFDVNGGQHKLALVEGFELMTKMETVFSAQKEMLEHARYADPNFTFDSAGSQWGPTRTGLVSLEAAAAAAINAELALPGATGNRRAQLITRRARVASVLAEVQTQFPAPGTGLAPIVITIQEKQAPFDNSLATDLFQRLRLTYGPGNFGGNIEATPAFTGAPFGKIIVGNFRDPNGDHMDPQVLRLLAKQKKQSIVEIDSSWLRVGHIDEFMCVVPNAAAPPPGPSAPSTAPPMPFAFLRGSPSVAISLIRAAHAQYLAGLPPGHLHLAAPDETRGDFFASLPFDGRLTDSGTSPVTRLLRGKGWQHRHPVGGTPLTDSPRFHRRLVEILDRSNSVGANFNLTGYVPGPGRDRRYRASLSVRELLACDRDINGISTQDAFEAAFVKPAFDVLAAQFPNIPDFPLPVLYDRASNASRVPGDAQFEPTIAFLPDLVNLQVVGKDLLIPKPYGPRMKPLDAIAVVQRVMQALPVPLPASVIARVNIGLINSRNLGVGRYWVEPLTTIAASLPGVTTALIVRGLETDADFIDEFQDSFPGASPAALQQNIIQANSGFFTSGFMTPGFHRLVINDGMVDIFELFTLAVVEDLGLVAHFVDSWFYHINDGGIHCGTNVLAQPPEDGSIPDPWRVPDVAELA